MNATYGYIRVSTEEQVDGTSLEEQVRRINGAAGINGLSEPEIFADPGVSGSVPLDLRPQGGVMYEKAKKGDTIIASKLDRMFRSASDALAKTEQLAARGVSLILVDISAEPLQSGANARLYFSMLAVFAEFERRTIAERLSAGRRAKRSSGGFAGGQVPFGYRVKGQGKAARLVEVPEEQVVVKRVHELLDRGLSLRATADVVGLDWNAVRRLKDRRNKETKA